MSARVAGIVGTVLFLVAVALLLVLFLDLLPWLILALGLIVFVGIVIALVVGALLLIFAAPYYFVTRRAEVRPESGTTLDRLKER